MTVGGIGHRMAEKPVRHGLQEIRALAGADLLQGFADGVAAHESALRIHEMHGAALPLAQPGGSSEELGHDTLRVRAPSKAVAVIAVGREDVIVGPQRVYGAHGHGLFPDVEVAEPADLAERVHLRGPFLEAPDQEHLRVEMQQLRSFHSGIVAEISGRRDWTDCQALPVYLAMIASCTGLGQGWYSLKSIVKVARP